MMTITMTIDQFNAISRLADFANWYIQGQEPSGEQFFSDLEDIQKGVAALYQVDQQLQFS
jgi:hypothetical protein